MHHPTPKSLLLFIALLLTLALQAQLCTGSLGAPIVNITFGSGSNPGPDLGINSYQYIPGDCPFDGIYTVRNNTNACHIDTWHSLSDHTGNPEGYFMLVNASFQPGDFFKQRLSGLCGNTTYEFAAWAVNVLKPTSCSGEGIKPNLTFSVETTSGTKIASFSSGDILPTNNPQWKQYGTFFTTPPDVSDVVVRITNNAPGGCGNDLALDDITIRPCGAIITPKIEGIGGSRLDLCAGVPATHRFVADVSGVYPNPELQWQESGDGGQTWSSIAGATAAAYQWTSGGAGTRLFRVLVADRGNINNITCRIASKQIQVVVHELPKVTLNPEAIVCEGSNLELVAHTGIDGTAGGAYQWITPQPSGFTVFEKQDAQSRKVHLLKKMATPQDAGMYTFRHSDANGCVGEATARLQVIKKPVPDFDVSGPACAGSPVQLKSNTGAQGRSIVAYSWLLGANEFSGEKDFTHVFKEAGSYPVRLWVAAEDGCKSDTVTKNVRVFAKPVAAFQVPEVCLADGYAQFTNNASVADGGPLSYRWTFGDPQNPAATSIETNPGYRYGAAGQYSVKLEATSAAGCRADSTQALTVKRSNTTVKFSLDAASVRCSTTPVVLRNISTVDGGAINRVAIFWKGDTDPIAVTMDEDPLPGKEYNFNYSPYITGAEQRFTIRVVVYSGISCPAEATQEIIIHKDPEVQFEALGAMCQGVAPVQLTGARELTGVSGTGTYSGPGVDASGRFHSSVAGMGVHTILYQFITAPGCRDTAMQKVQVWPQPQVHAGPDKTLVSGGSVTLAGSARGAGVQIQWTPATGLSNSGILQPVASPTENMVYRLQATSEHGCTAFDDVAVQVAPDIFIPNAFTPNGDGVNDTWQVPYLESIRDAEVRVFNRYGQEVFYSKENSRKWDGRFAGKDQPTGAYVYLIDLKNGKVLRGTVFLLR